MADSLVKRLDRDGREVARRFLIERDGPEGAKVGGAHLQYLRGELAGLSRAIWYVTGEETGAVEDRWLTYAGYGLSAKDKVPAQHDSLDDGLYAQGRRLMESEVPS